MVYVVLLSEQFGLSTFPTSKLVSFPYLFPHRFPFGATKVTAPTTPIGVARPLLVDAEASVRAKRTRLASPTQDGLVYTEGRPTYHTRFCLWWGLVGMGTCA